MTFRRTTSSGAQPSMGQWRPTAASDLRVGSPSSELEHEADRAADAVTRGRDVGHVSRLNGGVQRVCAECNDELQRAIDDELEDDLQAKLDPALLQREVGDELEDHLMPKLDPALLQREVDDELEDDLAPKLDPAMLQREPASVIDDELEDVDLSPKLNGPVQPSVPSWMAGELHSGGSGQPLATETRSFLEPKFGVDFSDVRVHAGASSHRMCDAINAKAFTRGRDLYFNQGEYDARTASGRHLLAHELTHVVQQRALKKHTAIGCQTYSGNSATTTTTGSAGISQTRAQTKCGTATSRPPKIV